MTEIDVTPDRREDVCMMASQDEEKMTLHPYAGGAGTVMEQRPY
jgi:hypothetical protein